MGTANTAQRNRLRYRIERDPQADILPPLHAVIGLIVVPWRYRTAAGLFHQRVLVEKLRRLRPHQRRGDLRRRRLKNKIAKFRDSLPVTIVLKKRRRAVLGDHGSRVTVLAGVRHQRGNAVRQALDPRREHAFK